MPLIKIDKNDAYEIIQDNHPAWFLIKEEIIGLGRWCVHKLYVVRNKKTGRYYALYTEEPATELQVDGGIFDHCDPTLTEVKPVVKPITVYEQV